MQDASETTRAFGFGQSVHEASLRTGCGCFKEAEVFITWFC